jgi:hypothetical protein
LAAMLARIVFVVLGSMRIVRMLVFTLAPRVLLRRNSLLLVDILVRLISVHMRRFKVPWRGNRVSVSIWRSVRRPVVCPIGRIASLT